MLVGIGGMAVVCWCPRCELVEVPAYFTVCSGGPLPSSPPPRTAQLNIIESLLRLPLLSRTDRASHFVEALKFAVSAIL